MSHFTQADWQRYLDYCVERMVAVGCTSIEAEVILRYAQECPPRGASIYESVEGLTGALELNPGSKEGFVFMANSGRIAQERVLALTHIQQEKLPIANLFYPDQQVLKDFVAAVKEELRKYWPHADEARINGAVYVSISNNKRTRSWDWNVANCDRCMRETEEVPIGR